MSSGMITRRHVLAGAASVGANGARRTVTFAAYAGLFQELYEPAVIAAFQRAYPGIDVFWYPISNPSQALAMLRREKANPSLDAVLLDPATARAAAEEGLLEPLTRATFPVLAELDPSAILPGLAGPALYSEPLVLLHDPRRVAPPSRWTALWERAPGRSIALPSPPDPIGIGFAITIARLFGVREGTPSLEAGFDAIAQLTPNVVSWQPRPDVYRFISDGNASFGVGWNFPARVHTARLNGHLAMTIPEDGTVSRVTTINLVRGSPAADTARHFIGWLLGGVAQNLMLEKLFLRPVNIRASYPAAALARTVSTGERNAPAMAIDWSWAASMREDIEARWRAVQRPHG